MNTKYNLVGYRKTRGLDKANKILFCFMIVFKILGKKHNVPTCWEDVTYRQYVALIRTSRLTEHISVFTGIDPKLIEGAEIKGLEKISISLSFLSFSPHFKRTRMVGSYIMPADITLQSTGQFEDLRALINRLPSKDADAVEAGEAIADLYLEACAIYCQKLRDGKYDSTKVPEVKEELKECPAAEVIGTGGFFLYKPLNMSPPTTKRYRIFSQRLKKWIRGLPGYQKTLDFLLPSSGSAGK